MYFVRNANQQITKNCSPHFRRRASAVIPDLTEDVQPVHAECRHTGAVVPEECAD